MDADGLGTQQTDGVTRAAEPMGSGGGGRTGAGADGGADAPLVAAPVFDFNPLTPRGQVVCPGTASASIR